MDDQFVLCIGSGSTKIAWETDQSITKGIGLGTWEWVVHYGA